MPSVETEQQLIARLARQRKDKHSYIGGRFEVTPWQKGLRLDALIPENGQSSQLMKHRENMIKMSKNNFKISNWNTF